MPDSRPLKTLFLGFNDPRRYIRGVENVIKVQAQAASGQCYYLYRGTKTEIHRWGRIIAISVPSNYIATFLVMNLIVRRLSSRDSLLIHGHSYNLSLLCLSRNLVFTIHDGLTYMKSFNGSKLPLPSIAVEFVIYWRARRIHSVSAFAWTKAQFSRLFRSKMSVIYNSDPRESLAGTYCADEMRAQYLLAVRSIEQRANIGLLLNLAASYAESQSPMTIVVAGKGPLLSHYREEAARRGLTNIDFRGYVSDAELDVLFRGATCILMPALYGEGFGLPIIEAYSRGRPVAASNVCAIPEVIYSPDHLFENDVASLVQSIECARQVPSHRYAAYYRDRFSSALIVKQYRNFYAGLLRPEREHP